LTPRWPDLLRLVRDVLPGRRDELREQVLELRIAWDELVQAGQDLLGFALLTNRMIGQLISVRNAITYRRPEMLLLDCLMLG
jgi:hypothetical protein